jgi:HAD superfamily phosphoserine phosphatase-like hydrolase
MKIAIFDLDGTLSKGASGAELSRSLEKAKVIKPGFIKAHDKIKEEFEAKRIGYNDIYQPFLDAVKVSYAGVDFTEVYKFTKETYQPITYIYDWVAPLFEDLHKKDYLISIVSATFDFYVELLQDELDFDTFYASSLELVGGVFTGDAKRPVIDSTKATYIKQLKDGNELLIVGDSKGDVPMLELADRGFYILHESGSNHADKPDFAHVEAVTRDEVAKRILEVA